MSKRPPLAVDRLRALVAEVLAIEDTEARARQLGALLAALAGDGRGTAGAPSRPSVLAELRAARSTAARELKADRSWREVGELFGIAGPRAQQIAVGVARSDRPRREA